MVPLLGSLARDARVHAPDLPGFGHSTRPAAPYDIPRLAAALASWMDAVGLADTLLIGNSVGCQVVAELAVTRPELVGAVVLNGPTMDPHRRTAGAQVLRWLADAPRERPSLGAVLLRDYLDCGSRTLVTTFRHALADRVERKLPRVSVPSLVVRGARDPIVSQAWAGEAAGLLPNGGLRVVPGVGHTVNYSGPIELARLSRPLLEA